MVWRRFWVAQYTGSNDCRQLDLPPPPSASIAAERCKCAVAAVPDAVAAARGRALCRVTRAERQSVGAVFRQLHDNADSCALTTQDCRPQWARRSGVSLKDLVGLPLAPMLGGIVKFGSRILYLARDIAALHNLVADSHVAPWLSGHCRACRSRPRRTICCLQRDAEGTAAQAYRQRVAVATAAADKAAAAAENFGGRRERLLRQGGRRLCGQFVEGAAPPPRGG